VIRRSEVRTLPGPSAQYSRLVLGIHETVMLILLLVVGVGYLIDRFAPAPDRGAGERESERQGEGP